MKIYFLFLLTLFAHPISAQVNDNNSLKCDSIILLDGTTKLVKVQKVNRKKIIYILCCDDCAVPREIKKNEIDTIIFIQDELIDEQVINLDSQQEILSKTNYLIDSTKHLEIMRKGEMIQVNQGEKIFIKASENKYKGQLFIFNDSTLLINDSPILISDIVMIAKPKTGKTVGLCFAALPIEFTGLVLIAGGITWGAEIIPAGVLTMGVGIVGVALEGSRGKRYHAYKIGQTDGTITRKWIYTIK